MLLQLSFIFICMSPWDKCIEASKVNLMKDEEHRKLDDGGRMDL